MSASGSRPRLPHDGRVLRHSARGLIALAAAAGVLLGVRTAGEQRAGGGEFLPRTVAPLLSYPTVYRRCDIAASDTLIPTTTCPGARDDLRRLLRRAGAASSAGGRAGRIEKQHFAAVLDLLSSSQVTAYDRAVASLRQVALLSRDRAPVLVDLSAAYLARAGHEQSVVDLLRGLDAALNAQALHPNSRAARYNRALALEALTADIQARAAWRSFLAVDDTSAWADEARRHLTRLRRGAGYSEARDRGPSAEALLRGWDALLPQWGEALLRGDSALAGHRLAEAWTIGAGLAAKGGDASLRDEVALLRSVPAPERLRLARVLAVYGAARRAYVSLTFSRADSLFSQIQGAAPGTPLDGWVTAFHAGTRTALRDTVGAFARIRQVAGDSVARRYPSLDARRAWIHGTLLARVGRPGEALEHYRYAERVYARLGERENVGFMRYLIADAQLAAGSRGQADVALRGAAYTLRSYPGSAWRHYVFATMARVAAQEGLRRAALEMLDEDVQVSGAAGVPAYGVEARLERARLRAELGDDEGARRDLAELDREIDVLERERGEYLHAVLAYTRGLVLLRHDPTVAEAQFERLLAFTGRGQEMWRTRGLARRAEARLAQGRTASARHDLDGLLSALDRQRERSQAAAGREAEGDIRALLARTAMHLVSGGDPGAALAYLERGSAALSAWSASHAWHPEVRPPPGRTVIRFLFAGDTMVQWVVTRDSMRVARTSVPARILADLGVRVRVALQADEDEVAAPYLARLYDLLVRPVERYLGAPGAEVVFVQDGALEGIPFAALYDDQGRAALVERYAVWLATSLAGAAAKRPLPVADRSAGTFVAPEFDEAANPGLSPLPGARAEAAAAARMYRATGLFGPAATAEAVSEALRRGPLVHFAGHAVFDPLRPARSYLLVAPKRVGDPGRLFAFQLDSLDLRHTRLIVLSACSSLGAADSGPPGFTGLAGALLGADAGAVLGSLWVVKDEETQGLMMRFHQAYRGSGDAPAALRTAQLSLLHSGEARLRSPAVWGSFALVGR